MEEEFYIEDESKGKIIGSIFVFIFIVIAILGVFFIYKNKNDIKVKKTIKQELGTKLETNVNYYLKDKVDEEDYDIDISNVLNEDGYLTEVGEYNVIVKYNNKSKNVKLKVVDTTPPDVEVQDLTVGINEEYDVADFVLKCTDLSKPCGVLYEKNDDSNKKEKEGEYKFNIIVSDNYGNETKKEVTLIVKKDYSYKSIKENDLIIDHVDDEYVDYNNEMILKFDKAIDEEELDDGEKSEAYHDLIASDLSIYLNEEDKYYQITSSEVVLVYNKYDYVIGVTFKVKLSNGEYRYLSK